MGWVRFEAERRFHRKLRQAGLAARGLDEVAMEHACAELTDGFVSDADVVLLGTYNGASAAVTRKLAATLTSVGRWERDDERRGWWIHDYLDYNPSRADWEKHSAAGKASGVARRRSNVNESDQSVRTKVTKVFERNRTIRSNESDQSVPNGSGGFVRNESDQSVPNRSRSRNFNLSAAATTLSLSDEPEPNSALRAAVPSPVGAEAAAASEAEPAQELPVDNVWEPAPTLVEITRKRVPSGVDLAHETAKYLADCDERGWAPNNSGWSAWMSHARPSVDVSPPVFQHPALVSQAHRIESSLIAARLSGDEDLAAELEAQLAAMTPEDAP